MESGKEKGNGRKEAGIDGRDGYYRDGDDNSGRATKRSAESDETVVLALEVKSTPGGE